MNEMMGCWGFAKLIHTFFLPLLEVQGYRKARSQPAPELDSRL